MTFFQAWKQIEYPLQIIFTAAFIPDAEGAKAQVFQHGHWSEDSSAFRGLGNAKADNFMAFHAQQRFSVKNYFTGTRAHQTAYSKQSCAFSGTVRAKDCHNFAFVHLQVYAMQHFNTAV